MDKGKDRGFFLPQSSVASYLQKSNVSDHVSFATQSTEGEKLGPGLHPWAEILSFLPQDGQVMWEAEEKDVHWHCHSPVKHRSAQTHMRALSQTSKEKLY